MFSGGLTVASGEIVPLAGRYISRQLICDALDFCRTGGWFKRGCNVLNCPELRALTSGGR